MIGPDHLSNHCPCPPLSKNPSRSPRKAEAQHLPVLFAAVLAWHVSGRLVAALAARTAFGSIRCAIFMAFLITLCAIAIRSGALLQRLIYGRRIAATEIKEPPVFIIGHWRSGTTYLHELMVCDERFAYPDVLRMLRAEPFSGDRLDSPRRCCGRCCPASGRWTTWPTGWHRPQEDEFALVAMGAPTPYYRMAFPNDPPPYNEFLDMDGCDPDDLDRWRREIERVRADAHATKKGQAADDEIAAAHRAHRRARQAVSRGEIHSHRARSVRLFFPAPAACGFRSIVAQGLQHPHHRDLDEYVLSRLRADVSRLQPPARQARFRPAAVRDEIRRSGARPDGPVAAAFTSSSSWAISSSLQPALKRTWARKKITKPTATSWNRNCAPKSAAAGAIISSGMGMSETKVPFVLCTRQCKIYTECTFDTFEVAGIRHEKRCSRYRTSVQNRRPQ